MRINMIMFLHILRVQIMSVEKIPISDNRIIDLLYELTKL